MRLHQPPIPLVLPVSEARDLWALAEAIQAAKTGQDRTVESHLSPTAIAFRGLTGEWWGSTYFDVPMNREVYHGHGDGGVDLHLACGDVAVKLNHRSDGYFMLERPSDFGPHLLAGVLVRGWCDRVRCTCWNRCPTEPLTLNGSGWILRDRFWKVHSQANWDRGERYYAQDWSLDALPVLLARHRAALAALTTEEKS